MGGLKAMTEQELKNLEAVFPAELVKNREGRGGKTYSYFDTPTIIRRLNECFGGDWSFEVKGHWVRDDEVVVLGEITAGGVVKQQFGESETERYSQGHKNAGKPLSIGDDLKSATSDCLKKCATLLGVGLELYDKKTGSRNGGGQGNAPPGNPDEKANPRQIKYIESLLKNAAIPMEVKDRAVAAIAKGMGKTQASESIEALKAIIEKAKGDGEAK
jgi:hypothetical protein